MKPSFLLQTMGTVLDVPIRPSATSSIADKRVSARNPFIQRQREVPDTQPVLAPPMRTHAASALLNQPFLSRNAAAVRQPIPQASLGTDFLDIEVMVDSLRDSGGSIVKPTGQFMYQTPQLGQVVAPIKRQNQPGADKARVKQIQHQDLSFTQLKSVPKQKQAPSEAVLSQLIAQEHEDLTQDHCDRLAMFVLQEQRPEKRKKMGLALGLGECGF